MRKNDGYVLIYVVFVILLLCAVVLWLCSSALSGVRVQNEAAEQMQSRYAVESKLEKFMAKASVSRDNSFERTGFDTEQAAVEGARAEFESLLASAAVEMGVNLSDAQWSGSDCRVSVYAQADDSSVSARIEFSLHADVNRREDDGTESFEYSLAAVTSAYLSYEPDWEGGAA